MNRFVARLREGADGLASLFFPPVCTLCGEYLPRGFRYLCPACEGALPRTMFHRLGNANPMEQRIGSLVKFRRATAFLFYSPQSAVARCIYDFKYHGFPGLARFLGFAGAREIAVTGFFPAIDLVIPVPLHITKELMRGYNQSRMIALGVAEALGAKTGNNLVARRAHDSQTSKSHYLRWLNTENIFAVRRPEELSGKRILIVDDVFTTGATFVSAARAVAAAVSDAEISFYTIGFTL